MNRTAVEGDPPGPPPLPTRPSSQRVTAPAIEAARQAILRRLEQLLPGAGALTVAPTVVHLNKTVIYTCKRSNRLGVVNLWVTMDSDPEVLAERAIAELETTQVHALEAP